MNNLEEFIFYDKIFKEDELLKLNEIASSLKMKRVVDSIDKKKIYSQISNRNVSTDINFNFNYDKIIEKYISHLPVKYRMYFNSLFFDNGYFIDDKITKYDQNDDYKWHMDFDFDVRGIRCLSTVTYLNDDYDGGETEFINKIIKPKKGYTLIFPSTWLFPHQGNQVFSNSKLVYVCHFWLSFKKINKVNIQLPSIYF